VNVKTFTSPSDKMRSRYKMFLDPRFPVTIFVSREMRASGRVSLGSRSKTGFRVHGIPFFFGMDRYTGSDNRFPKISSVCRIIKGFVVKIVGNERKSWIFVNVVKKR